MWFLDDITSGIMRKVSKVTDNITSTVSDVVSGIAEEVSKVQYESKFSPTARKSDLLDLPFRARRCIDKQKRLTDHLHYLIIPDEKKREECQNKVKSLCGELDNIGNELFKVKEDFKFSNDKDDEKLKAEVAELEKLYSPVIEKHKNILRDLYAAIDDVNDFIYRHEDHFLDHFEDEVSFFGTYLYEEITCLDSKIRIQKIFWERAQRQYEDPEKYKEIADLIGSMKCPF